MIFYFYDFGVCFSENLGVLARDFGVLVRGSARNDQIEASDWLDLID